MSVLDSYDAILQSIATHGAWRRHVSVQSSTGTTQPTTTAGGINGVKRFHQTLVVPSMGAGILGMYLIKAMVSNGVSQPQDSDAIAIEYNLGSIDLATGVFTAGVAMPSKRYSGRPAVQSSSQFACLGVSANATATTPTITVDYTNQDGVAGRSCSLVLPTNPVSSSNYILTNILQAGDVGIRSVQGMTKSDGTAGIVNVYGYLILVSAPSTAEEGGGPLVSTMPNWLLETGDKIVFLGPGQRAVSLVSASLVGVAET